MHFGLAVTSMRAELPSGKVPTTLVLLLISRLIRSILLFVLAYSPPELEHYLGRPQVVL